MNLDGYHYHWLPQPLVSPPHVDQKPPEVIKVPTCQAGRSHSTWTGGCVGDDGPLQTGGSDRPFGSGYWFLQFKLRHSRT